MGDTPTHEIPLLLDVTLRDGGYVNGHEWTLDEAESIVRAVGAAGVRWAEVGYLRSGHYDPLRPSASCPSSYLRRLTGGDAQLVVMVRTERADAADLERLAEDGVGMVRIVVPGGDVNAVAPYVAVARAAGMTVAVNLTRASESSPAALAAAARRAAGIGAQLVYLADSNGSLFPEGVQTRIAAAVEATPVPVGFHAHDNLGLAFINSCVALRAGARAVDGSLAGIGKGGGNLKLELIVAHWIVERAARLRIDPLVGNYAVFATQLRMLTDGHCGSLVAGLLDVNLDGARDYAEGVAALGFDAMLHAGAAPSQAVPSSREGRQHRILAAYRRTNHTKKERTS